MVGKTIGHGFAVARDVVARVLIKLKVSPNALTFLGVLITAGAGVCFALGAGHRLQWTLVPRGAKSAYLMLAAGLLILSAACDMLDGAVARIGKLNTRFGAFLDSTLDRYSDFVVFAGIAVYFSCLRPSNITFVLLALMAVFNGFMISYTRARAEDIIGECKVGYWQRGERVAAILIATFAHNIPAMLLQQALLPTLTVLRRIFYTKSVIDGKTPIADPRQGGWWLKVRLWRYPRGTWAYDVVTGANIAWLLFAPIPATWDPIRKLLL